MLKYFQIDLGSKKLSYNSQHSSDILDSLYPWIQINQSNKGKIRNRNENIERNFQHIRTKMEALGPLMRKFDFPESVLEALKIVHLQCEKMSLNPTSTLMSQELSQVTDFVDEFVFGNPQKKSKKLNCIEQLQVRFNS